LVRFRQIVGPLILSLILAYLFFPLARRLHARSALSWRGSVNSIYLIVVIVVAGLLTLTGLAVISQIQSLIGIVERFVTDLPNLVQNLASQVYVVGPYTLNFGQMVDLQTLTNEILSIVQPLLGRVGGVITSFAGSAMVTLGWSLFVLVISYFLLAEAEVFPEQLIRLDIPGYEADIRRLVVELQVIWNAFLRGQLLIILLVMVSYTVLLNILGMRYTFAIAILAGLARLVPYIGPLVVWTVTTLVAFFLPHNYFGLSSLYFAILVLACCLILDQIFDNLISPRILGNTLRVHPAAILIAAIIFANLIGIIGLVLAAPVVATLNLFSRYMFRKMLDRDPWPDTDIQPRSVGLGWGRMRRGLKGYLDNLNRK
jgi:predicted PurR-regulated permease PerM